MKKRDLFTKGYQKYSKLKDRGQEHPSMMGIIHSSCSPNKTIEEETGVSSKKSCWFIFRHKHSVALPPSTGNEFFW